MNLTIIIGWVGCIGLVLYGILSAGDLGMFADVPSVLITVGGCLSAMIAQTPLSTLKNIGKFFKIAIMPTKFDPHKYIAELVEYATTARSKGLLALEESANNAADPFMKQALMIIVDGNDPDKVREMLETAVDSMAERHGAGSNFFGVGVSMGPGFGMIGTLIGLIIMLNGMADNPDDLGGSMAIAMITTFYGSMLANVIFAPLENALKNAHADEELCMNIIIEGVMGIAAGSNPRMIQEKLEFMVPRSSLKKDEKK